MGSDDQSQEPINLSRGHPNPGLLPTAALTDAATKALTDPSISTPALLYGPDEGYHPLREHIAQWMTEYYQPREPVSVDRITISGGASQNLGCILQVFTDPVYTRNVWMVAPTYFLACSMFEDAGFAGRLRAVPQDDIHGVDIDFLRQELTVAEKKAAADGNCTPTYKPARPWAHIYKHVIYLVPTFSNPTGRTMPLSERENLVRLARDFDALIVCDDVYDFLQWSADPRAPLHPSDTAPQPRLVDVDRFLDGGPSTPFGNVVSNGSFSKVIGPGLRTGWAEGTPQLAYGLSQTGTSRSGGAPSQATAAIIAQLFPQRTIHSFVAEVLRPAYARRYRLVVDALREHLLPLGATLPGLDSDAGGPVGGYYVWVRLPEPLRASELPLGRFGVAVGVGASFAVRGDPAVENSGFDRGVRVCFAWEEEGKLVEGVKRLAGAVRCALG
ncbi:aromatic amino acid aminotransferase [Aspergillus campestris IBT 28561]|uniref:Aromatic amino acid aminotransferase n=1 Tax=Aspergillus campestris (strain IBT 28561) TaxID=1392248 RepID=A0A2I1DFG1_ASPC2|nr:aromatic amino acid aminotransferase [Aspergillus campestris IBT 28561]PKY08612.1 aromatic amino acid aminotransferase [Aspergillus campestris IBT 28561]